MNLSNFPIEALSKEALISLVKAYDQQSVNNDYQKIIIEKQENEIKELKELYRDDGYEMRKLKKEIEELKKENEKLKKLNETGEDDSDSEEEEEEGKKKYLDNDGLNEEDGEEVEDIF